MMRDTAEPNSREIKPSGANGTVCVPFPADHDEDSLLEVQITKYILVGEGMLKRVTAFSGDFYIHLRYFFLLFEHLKKFGIC